MQDKNDIYNQKPNERIKKTFFITKDAISYLDISLRVEVKANVDKITSIQVLKENELYKSFYDKIVLEKNNKGQIICKIDLPDSEWTKDGEYDITLVMDEENEKVAKNIGVLIMYNYLIYIGKLSDATTILVNTTNKKVDIQIDEFENYINDYVCEYIKPAEIKSAIDINNI